MVKVSDSVRSTHNHDGAVVLDILQGQIYGLNIVGSRILELLKQNYEQAQIAEAVGRQFGIDQATADADVAEFLDSLEKHHLIEHRDNGGGR